jgi:hypothetical protein
LRAYEFLTKDHSLIVSRKNAEKPSLTSLRNEYQIHLSKASEHLMEYLEKSKSNYQENVKIIDKLKGDKEKYFDEWFEGSKELFNSFDTTSNKKVADLEELYSSKLMLKEPAKYWEERAIELKTEGAKWMKYLLWSTSVGAGLLFILLLVIANNQFEEIFSFSGKTIRWSILFITMMSLIAFLVRTFTKLTFSTYHLVRDSEERKQLTYVYLALLENKAVSEDERQIILQSLFSRADTGLLKDDSSPTMPSSSFIEKSINNR